MGKSSVDKDRKARVEQMRRQQESAERRRTMLVMGAALLVVAVLVGLVVVAIMDYRRDNPEVTAGSVSEIGVEASAASCDEVQSEPAEGVNAHVEVGTTVEYANAPAAFGEHYPSPEFPASPFYTVDDRPAIEHLVHNLEHGYTVAWYDPELPEDQQQQLSHIAELAREMDETANGKFISAPWDESYGEMPDDKPVVLAHWGASEGYLQHCGAVSGEVVQKFIEDHPYSDSPEPNAQ